MTANVKKYVYAMNVWGAGVSNKDIVYWSVLRGITTTQKKDEIYTHEVYGLDSLEKLTNWMEACANQTGPMH